MEASGADGGEDREREGSSEDCSGSQLGSDEGEAGAGQGAEQKRVKTGNSSKQTLPGCQPSGLPSSSNGLRSLLGLGRGDASPWGGTQQSGGGQGMGSAQLGSGSGAHAMESAPIDSHLIKVVLCLKCFLCSQARCRQGMGVLFLYFCEGAWGQLKGNSDLISCR